jgi:RsiW-degrading membrane proteinase PrsW (M82 family)
MAALGAFLGWHVFVSYCGVKLFDKQRQLACASWALTALVVTAAISAAVLLAFRHLAIAAEQSHWAYRCESYLRTHKVKIWRVWWIIVLLLALEFFGRCFLSEMRAENVSLFDALFGMLVTVGILEEIVKLLPVLVLVSSAKAEELDVRSVGFVGAMSGLGFGVVEGLHYSYAIYLPAECPAGIYVMRFISIAFMHAAWTLLAALLVFRFRGTGQRLMAMAEGGGWEIWVGIGCVVAVCFPSALIHACYNVFGSNEGPFVSVCINGVLVGAMSYWPVSSET